ncbi:MAG: T9SS type A sorting domain-containing protein [candidate division WOR-3 bacterium]|nr:MAG: T9SS type A sorting domain-containing protein [candidate division WOR-3 bacterium]
MLIIITSLLLTIPYPNQPDWESIDDDYSTGGALVDVNLDGLIDFITGNGNDMDQDPNRVYYNTGDSLEYTASWVSGDLGYNAKVSVGDIDYDGYPDLAVANYGDPGAPQYDKFYYNISGTYESTSSWQPADLDNSFGCAFGDMDGDGDLDLAVACGEDYTNQAQRAKVYLNNAGVLDTVAAWESNLLSYFYDVTWVDIDADGDLDLALAGMHVQNLIYRNTGGMLESSPCWQSQNSLGTIEFAFGDVDNDNDEDMVCANNAQTGGQSYCELYLNNGITLETTPVWTSQSLNYYSCVALGDVDRDGDLDLAAGGWWETVKVFENTSGTFPQTPDWEWQPGNPYQLVCEHISFGDVDNTVQAQVESEPHVVDSLNRVFYLANRWLRSVDSVRTGSHTFGLDEYCFSYAEGWVSLGNTVTVAETVWVDYSYSLDLDLVVTNWSENPGNFLFYNRYSSGAAEHIALETPARVIIPTPTRGSFHVYAPFTDIRLKIYDSMGRLVRSQTGSQVDLRTAGVYFVRVYDGIELKAHKKVVIVD